MSAKDYEWRGGCDVGFRDEPGRDIAGAPGNDYRKMHRKRGPFEFLAIPYRVRWW